MPLSRFLHQLAGTHKLDHSKYVLISYLLSATENHTSGDAVSEQLAVVGRGEVGLDRRLAAAAVEDIGLAEDTPDIAGDRAHVLGLEAKRGVADAGGQGRVDRTAEGRIEQRRRIAAVDDADRVVVLLARLALEDGAAIAELDRAHPHR